MPRQRWSARRLKIVLDASVVVSSAFGGIPAEAVRKANALTLVASPPILAELERVKAHLRHQLTPAQHRELRRVIRNIADRAQLVTIRGAEMASIPAFSRSPRSSAPASRSPASPGRARSRSCSPSGTAFSRTR